MREIYLVLDEYEDNDGYFTYSAAFEKEEEANKFKDLIIEHNRKRGYETNHDVFPVIIHDDKTPEEVLEHITGGSK